MLIICKSCKKLIDTDKHDFCPKCGSNFNYGENLTVTNHTEDYEEYERRMAEQQRAAVENRMNNTKQATKKETQKRLKKQADKAQGKKNGCIGCFAVVIFLLASFGSILSDEDIDLDELFSDDYSTAAQTTAYTAPVISFDAPDYVDIESTDDEYDPAPYIGGGVGDTAYGDTYNFTLTELSVYENEFFPPSEGCVYMSFTLSLENTSDSSRLFYELPVVEANGKECNFAGFSGLFIPGELAPGEVYEKAVIYEVPTDTVFLDIYYGDETAIYILGYDIEGFEPDFGYEYDGNDSQY